MKAAELKLALAMAQDPSVDTMRPELEGPFSAMCGFGLPDFEPIEVPMLAVVKMLRWQCACLDGSWDWKQYSEDKPYLLRRFEIAEMSRPEAAALVAQVCGGILAGEAA